MMFNKKYRYRNWFANEFHEEVEIQKLLANLKLAPKVLSSLTTDCGNNHFDYMLCMERLGQDAISKFNACSDTTDKVNIYVQCIDIIKRIHDAGIYHGDTRLENFVYDDSDNSFKAIDFESSGYITAEMVKKDLPYGTIRSQETAKYYDLYRFMMLSHFYFSDDFIDAIPMIWKASEYLRHIYNNDQSKMFDDAEYEKIANIRKSRTEENK